MKKLSCLVLVFVLVISLCVITTGAIPAPHYYGDANCDYSVDITDSTEIQRSLVSLSELSSLGEFLADVDADGKVTVLDATMIQQREADMIKRFNHTEEYVYTYIDINNLTANFDSGKAMVGVPVTFEVSAYCPYEKPLSYKYEIYSTQSEEPIFVSQLSESPEFTYTFEETGYYMVNSIVYNAFGEWTMYDMIYSVGEYSDDDSLRISAINQNQTYLNEFEVVTITAYAYGGTAPYEYKFELDKYHNVKDFSEDNSFKIGKLPLGSYSVKVTVKDANGDESTSSYQFEVEEPWT